MAKKRKKIVVRDGRQTAGRLALLFLSVLLVSGAVIAVVFIARSCGVMLSTRVMPFDSSSEYCGTGDGIMYLRGGYMNFYDFKDEDGSYSLELSNVPDGLVGSPGVKAMYSEGAVQIVNAPFNIEVDGTVKKVRCGSAHAAVCKLRSTGETELKIYSSTGQQVLQLPNSGDPNACYAPGQLIDFGFSEADGCVLWTMELFTDSGSPRTTITTYDLNRMTNSGIITVQGQLVERVFFTESGIYAVGTESIIRYGAADNREKYRVQIYGYRVEDISLCGDRPCMLLVPRDGGELSSARILSVSEKDVAGETAVSVLLPEGTVSCHMVNGMLAVVTSGGVRIYGTDGKLLERLDLSASAITSSDELDEHHILLERSGEYTLLTVGK